MTAGVSAAAGLDRRDLRAAALAAVAKARKQDRPVLLSWDADIDVDADLVGLWDTFRTFTDRSFFWSSPWSGRQLAAAGSMLDISGERPDRFSDVHRKWTRVTQDAVITGSSSPVLLGGFAFRAARSVERPTVLPDALLWLPTALLVRDTAGSPAHLTLNAVARAHTDPDAIASELIAFGRQLLAPTSRRRRSTGPGNAHQVSRREMSRRELPSKPSWQHLVADAVAEIRQGAFEKVVLARRVDIQADSRFDLLRALRHLTATSPHTTVFAAELQGRCFLGATPEYLMQVTDGSVRTLGLAGSAPRGASAEEDDEIERRLLASDKDNHEHALVTRRLVKVLNEHCVDVWKEPGPGVLKLPHIQHLCTRLGGRLGRSGLLQLVAALHPTPALGGHPSPEALRWLDANEPLDRGWYAAPVGWVDANGEGEFAVAIRSALISGRIASLYTGCGVVADSEPAAEYQETEVKLQGMLRALGAA